MCFVCLLGEQKRLGTEEEDMVGWGWGVEGQWALAVITSTLRHTTCSNVGLDLQLESDDGGGGKEVLPACR